MPRNRPLVVVIDNQEFVVNGKMEVFHQLDKQGPKRLVLAYDAATDNLQVAEDIKSGRLSEAQIQEVGARTEQPRTDNPLRAATEGVTATTDPNNPRNIPSGTAQPGGVIPKATAARVFADPQNFQPEAVQQQSTKAVPENMPATGGPNPQASSSASNANFMAGTNSVRNPGATLPANQASAQQTEEARNNPKPEDVQTAGGQVANPQSNNPTTITNPTTTVNPAKVQ